MCRPGWCGRGWRGDLFEPLTSVSESVCGIGVPLTLVSENPQVDMSHRHSHNTLGHAHFLTFSCLQRQKFLIDEVACSSLAVSIDAAREIEGFDLWAYVFMPEHVHLLIHPRTEDYEIAKILRRIKEPVAREVLARWRQSVPDHMRQAADTTDGPVTHRFWQPGGGFDRNVHDIEVISKAIDYIEWNPVRRGLIGDPIDWKWSSAGARAGRADVALRIEEVSWGITGPTGIADRH